MIIHEMAQRSPEWYNIKCGKISASSMSDVLAKGKGVTRRNYMIKLIAERLSGIPQETYQNGAMQWGIDTEPLARQAYEESTLTVVNQVGFVEMSEFVGCSPDGFVGEDGLVEIKCPNTSTHVETILDNRLPPEYVAQVQSQMWICERKWCHFVSFDPRLSPRPLWFIKVEQDDKYISLIEAAVDTFVNEMLELEAKIRKI